MREMLTQYWKPRFQQGKNHEMWSCLLLGTTGDSGKDAQNLVPWQRATSVDREMSRASDGIVGGEGKHQ